MKQELLQAKLIGNGYDRSRARAGLAARLADLAGPASALDVVNDIADDSERSDVLVALASHLTDDVMERVLTLVSAIASEEHRAPDHSKGRLPVPQGKEGSDEQ